MSVNYATANDSAIAPGDFAAATGTLNFAAGVTTQTVTVLVNGDLLDELNETFFVDLSSPSNATLGDGQGLGTITDDDPEPRCRSTTSPSTRPTTHLHGDPLDGQRPHRHGRLCDGGRYGYLARAHVGRDGLPTGRRNAHLLRRTDLEAVTVDVHDGNHHELAETFFLNLTNASGASISDAQGVATIIDNDPPPEVTIDDVVLNEADGELSFTLLKSAQTGAPATVDYTTTSGSATSPDRLTASSAERSPSAGPTQSRTSPCRSPTTPSTRAPRRSRSPFRTPRA